jgi:hypothetical protein
MGEFTREELLWAHKKGWEFSRYGRSLIHGLTHAYMIDHIFPTKIAFTPDKDTEFLLRLMQ